MKKYLAAGLAVCVIVLCASRIVNALTIQGGLWAPATAWSINPGSAGLNPTLTTAPIATFTVDAINFDSRISGVDTYQEFLQGGSNNNNINNLQWSDPDWTWTGGGTTLNANSFYTAGGIGSFFQFTGIAYFATNTVVTHDDGFWLNLGGTIFDRSTPVSPTITTLANVAGNYNFALNYGAYNGFPEVLVARGINDPVPEPATMLLFGAGLTGLAVARRRKKVS